MMTIHLYVNDLILIGMMDEFKQAMAKEFEIIDTGLMFYVLGLEVKQLIDDIFVRQEHYLK